MSANGRALGPSIRTEGGLLPADLLARVASNDPRVPGLTLAAYHLDAGLRFGEAITRSWNRLIGSWAAFQAERAALPGGDPGTTVTRERWLLPLFDELGYGRLQRATAVDVEGKTYPVSHAWNAVPIHLIGCRVALDRRTERVAGAAGQVPHGLVQELLNRSSERLWGFVSNGLTLRILRDNATLTRQAYVEFDLEAIFDGEAYADFALLWLVAHQSRVEGEKPETCWLEQWTTFAAEAGTRALDKLRAGVETAISALGSGFLGHPANGDLRDALRDGALDKQDYYRELLRLVYRLLFLFTAEDCGLLLDPGADDLTRRRYLDHYSTARLRRLAERRKGSRHADQWAGLKVVLAALGSDTAAPGLGLPALGGFLFSDDACPRLDRAEIANRDLLDAVRALATIEDGRVRRSVDYRNLGAEELGGVYESLLELHPELDANAGTFALKTAGGHERKTTGSYYTPTSLINVLLDSALDPVLAEAAAQPDPAAAILRLAVVDPAAGSGHFLVAAAHRIAKRLATVRTGDEEPSPGAVRTALRDVIGNCIYAVDLNPMAVELCKVSLWLEAIEPGKPLSFLDAHIKCGNSLLGTTPELVTAGIPDAACEPILEDDKSLSRELRKRNKAEREGQLTFDEATVPVPTADLAASISSLDELPDGAIEGVRAKASRFDELLNSPTYREARMLADAWCAAFVIPKSVGTPAITTSTLRRMARDIDGTPTLLASQIQRHAADYRFFHWPIEFPVVFARGGFDLVIGNPPFVNSIEGGIDPRSKGLLRHHHPDLGGTADLAYFFLDQTLGLASSRGRVGLVQPRALLTANATARLRSRQGRLRPNTIYASARSDFFPGAAVFVCLIAFGPDSECRVSDSLSPLGVEWVSGQLLSENWWSEMQRLLSGEAVPEFPASEELGSTFTAYSSMFIQEFYETARIVVDSRDDVGPKLVTTGLIDPNECLWGRAKCRYMKRDYDFPRVPFSADTSTALRRKLELSRRPKIIVAGLGSRVECFLDAKGEFIGAVSTFSIVHPEDDLDRLAELVRVLLHPDVTRLFRSQLGGNAMGGGSITMRKAFLEHLPIGRYDDPGVVTRAVSAPATSFPVRPGAPQVHYPEAVPALRRAAEGTAPALASTPNATQGTLADLARTVAASADWLPEEAVDAGSVVPGRHVRHRRFGEGVVIEVRRTVKPPTLTIRFGTSDDREIAIGYGLIEFEAE